MDHLIDNCEKIQINMGLLTLRWKTPWKGPPAPHLLRGAIASIFPDNDLFHQHSDGGKEIYRYPRVQYRWSNGDGLIVGIGSAVEAMAKLFLVDHELRLGNRLMVVSEGRMKFSKSTVGLSSRLLRYRFVSPWLPFNQENFKAYNRMSREQQQRELDRIAVGNILSALKGLDIRVNSCVYAAITPRKRCRCVHKGNQLAGILGTLITNVMLPDDFAIGKAVSHGYGWIKTVKANTDEKYQSSPASVRSS